MNPSFSINKMSNLNKSSPPFTFKINESFIYDTNANANLNANANPNYNNEPTSNKKNKKGKGNNHANDNHKHFYESTDLGNHSPEKEKIISSVPISDTSPNTSQIVEDTPPILTAEETPVKPDEQSYTSFNATENVENANTNEPPIQIPEPNNNNPNITINTTALEETDKNPWDDRYLVDPLSVIIKLSLLGKKDVNTKLSIIHNAVQIHEIGLFQGIARFYYNSNKFDIYYLHTPIKYACIHFLLNKFTPEYDKESIRKLFGNAIHGLEKLIITYKSCAIVELCLNNYIDIIRNSINDTYNPTLYKNDKYNIYYTEDLTSNMFSLWTADKMQIVLNMNEYIYTDNNKSIESIRSLETFMAGIDADIKKIVEKNGFKNIVKFLTK